jgi:hypothetical protein
MVYHSYGLVNAKRSEVTGTHEVQEYINEYHTIFEKSEVEL